MLGMYMWTTLKPFEQCVQGCTTTKHYILGKCLEGLGVFCMMTKCVN